MRPITQFIVVLGSGGRVVNHGPLKDALAHDPSLESELEREEASLKQETATEDTDENLDDKAISATGKLVVTEEVAVGRISRRASKLFNENGARRTDLLFLLVSLMLTAMGGKWPALFWLSIIVAIFAREGCARFGTWWLGHWARQFEKHTPSEINSLG
jgi:hypothetical protein